MNDHIAEASKKVGRPQIREVFLRNGAQLDPDRDDLPDWTYESAFELLELAAPIVQGEPVGWQPVDELYLDYRHPKTGKACTVSLSREEVVGRMDQEIFEKLTACFCKCEPVGETNVVECRCDEYADEFELVTAPQPAEQQPAPDVAGIMEDDQFLLERLSEMEGHLVEDELCRTYLGHVAPAAARLGAKVAVLRNQGGEA